MKTRGEGATLDYITRTFVSEPDCVRAAREKGEQLRPGMQVSPYEGYLLHWLVRISGAQTILEIGTFMGTSTLWMAEALGPGGRITALEADAGYAEAATQHIAASPHSAKVKLIHANAHGWINASLRQPTYDLVFIDAEKAGYADYLDAVLPRMKPHGMIVGDNTLLFGAMAGEEPDVKLSDAAKASMKRFNETLANRTRFDGILLPTPEGLTVARLKS